MNSFDFSMYDYGDETEDNAGPVTNQDQPKPKIQPISPIELPESKGDFDFSVYDYEDEKPSENKTEEDSFGKNLLRTLYQIPSGIAQGITYPLDLISMIGTGESLDPEEIEHIKRISEREGVPFDEEKYLQAVQGAQEAFPTQGNVERFIESKTGLPLEAKTRLQKGIKFASTAGKVAPTNSTFRGLNTSLPKPVLGTGVAATKELLDELGIPETISDIASFGVLKNPTAGAGKISVGPKKKPSGMSELRYEKLNKPTQVSESKFNKIQDRHKQEFTDLANKIIKESPIGETSQSLKNDVTFKQKTAEGFEDLQKLAEKIPDKLSTEYLKNDLLKNLNNKNTGITPSEFEKSHNKFIKEFVKETPTKDVGFPELLSQYRKNNKELGKVFEPGQSYAYNSAKRESLLDYNNSIADVFENKFPNSGFSEPFKELNKKWTQISDAELIEKFLGDMLDGKINYKKGREFFDKQGMTVPFQRAMGKEGFSKFETLMKDMMSTEQASKLLKEAKSQGFGDLAKIAGSYIIHPELAQAKLGFNLLKGGYNTIFEMLLDKPQLAVTWDRGINAFKKGNFKAAQTELGKVSEAKKDFDLKESSRKEALRNFNDKKNLKN